MSQLRVEQFTRTNNFCLWRTYVMNIIVHLDLEEALEGQPAEMSHKKETRWIYYLWSLVLTIDTRLHKEYFVEYFVQYDRNLYPHNMKNDDLQLST